MQQRPARDKTYLRILWRQHCPKNHAKGTTQYYSSRIIQAELSATLNGILRRSGIATAFPELRCNFGECSIVPDIAVFKDSRIPRI
jgi:hypothetical protein